VNKTIAPRARVPDCPWLLTVVVARRRSQSLTGNMNVKVNVSVVVVENMRGPHPDVPASARLFEAESAIQSGETVRSGEPIRTTT